MNKRDLDEAEPVVSEEPQPRSLLRTLEKLAEIPRRSNVRETGFDGVGVVVVDGANDGRPFSRELPERDDVLYEAKYHRLGAVD